MSADVASRLISLWGKMLRTTRMPLHPTGGADGVTYHFAGVGMAGQTWSPRPDTRVGRLVEVAHTLAALISTTPEKRSEYEQRLSAHLDWFRV